MEGYEYCECARQYLLERLNTSHKDEKDIAATIGYGDFGKFRRHQDAWHALERPIPRRYLAAIGADVDILRGALERDLVNFQMEEAMPRSPVAYTVRIAPTVYQTRFFEGSIPEEEAMRRVKAIAAESGFSCRIDYYQIMTVGIEPDGKVSKTYYRPTMKVTNNWVAFKHDSSRVETMSIT